MGMTFSTIQIKSLCQAEPERFVQLLRSYMEQKGFVSVPKEDAQFSCRLAVSAHSDWATLSYNEYGSGEYFGRIKEDAQNLAQMLAMDCVVTSVWDSDMIMLELFGASSAQNDTLYGGRLLWADDDSTPKANSEIWKPLLCENATWEQVSNILNGQYTFAEEALSDIALLFGMDEKNIMRDYRYWEEAEPDSANVTVFHFKTSLPQYLKEGATVLRFGSMNYPISEKECLASFYNVGGVSKGLGIFFVGDCFKDSDVEIGEITVRRYKDPYHYRDTKYPDDYEFFTSKLKKVDFSDGRHGLYTWIEDYTFYEGINLDHPFVADNFGFQSDIMYTPTIVFGEQYSIVFGVSPLSNQMEGQVRWKTEIYKTREHVDAYGKASYESTTQKELTELVKNENGNIVKNTRIRAVKRLNDQVYLAEIAEKDNDDDVRKAATKRLDKLQKEG